VDLTRRRFLQLTGTLAASGMTTSLWARVGARAGVLDSSASATRAPKLLVMLFDGGNDGLNTVIPYGLGEYYGKRPTIAIPQSKVLTLADSHTVGLHPNLTRLRGLYADRQVAIVQGVGYDQPDLSHFGSMDIWQSGSPTHAASTGWLGRYLDLTPDKSSAFRAVAIGSALPQVLVGAADTGVAVPSFGSFTFYDGLDTDRTSEPYRIHQAFVRAASPGHSSGDPTADALMGADRTAVTAVRKINSLGDTGAPPPQSLADQVSMAMTLLGSDLGIRIAFVGLASFDDHAAEQANHDPLLAQVDQAIGRFADLAAKAPHPESYLLMTFSEFGRRVEEDGSGGTDHGTAGPLFVVGRRARGGLYGAQPSLADRTLDANGNLVRAVDFREVYATILDDWLGGANSREVLGRRAGDGLHPVPFIKT